MGMGSDMHATSRLSVHTRHTFAAVAVAAASATFTPPVLAADMPIKASPDRVVAPLWTGFYVGAHGGWGWGKTEISDPIFSPPFNPTEATFSGPLAGGQI